jgi:hypothetical protein
LPWIQGANTRRLHSLRSGCVVKQRFFSGVAGIIAGDCAAMRSHERSAKDVGIEDFYFDPYSDPFLPSMNVKSQYAPFPPPCQASLSIIFRISWHPVTRHLNFSSNHMNLIGICRRRMVQFRMASRSTHMPVCSRCCRPERWHGTARPTQAPSVTTDINKSHCRGKVA